LGALVALRAKMGDTPRSRTAAQSLYDEMARKPSGASLAPACRPRRVAHTPAGAGDSPRAAPAAPAAAPADAAPPAEAAPAAPRGLRDRLSAAAEAMAPPRGCNPRAPLGKGLGAAKLPAHLYEEAQAVGEVMTESARAAAEAVSAAAAKTAAGMRRAAELGVEVGEAAVKGFWDRVLPDPELEEKLEEAAREAAARGYSGVRMHGMAMLRHSALTRRPGRAGCGAVEGAGQPHVQGRPIR
jgi:hypothetical protein